MKDFKNWREITTGLYRYVIAPGACYEIHIIYWNKETDILTAKANLFIVGDWINNQSKKKTIEREELLHEQPIFECISKAIEDEKENNN